MQKAAENKMEKAKAKAVERRAHVSLSVEQKSGDFTFKMRVKKFVPDKRGDIGMEVYYLCQHNTYVIAREFGEQQ